MSLRISPDRTAVDKIYHTWNYLQYTHKKIFCDFFLEPATSARHHIKEK